MHKRWGQYTTLVQWLSYSTLLHPLSWICMGVANFSGLSKVVFNSLCKLYYKTPKGTAQCHNSKRYCANLSPKYNGHLTCCKTYEKNLIAVQGSILMGIVNRKYNHKQRLQLNKPNYCDLCSCFRATKCFCNMFDAGYSRNIRRTALGGKSTCQCARA